MKIEVKKSKKPVKYKDALDFMEQSKGYKS